MASKSVSAEGGFGSVERVAGTVVRAIAGVMSAVGEGMQARNNYVALVSQGVAPSEAAARALKPLQSH